MSDFCDEAGRRAEIPAEQHADGLDTATTGSEDTALREESSLKAPKVLEVHL